MKTPGHLHEMKVVLSTCEGDFGLLYRDIVSGYFSVWIHVAAAAPRTAPCIRTQLIPVSRQFQELFIASRLYCAPKHELVVKPEDIIPNNNVGVLSLNKSRPCEQYIRFRSITFDL